MKSEINNKNKRKYYKYKSKYKMAQTDSPTTHTLRFINDKDCPLLDYIRDGLKTVEGRKYSERYRSIKKDDIIKFVARNEKPVYVRVTYVHKYKTLEDYLIEETIEKTLPCVKTIDDGLKIYNKWTSEKERNDLLSKHGYSFLGIGIKVIIL